MLAGGVAAPGEGAAADPAFAAAGDGEVALGAATDSFAGGVTDILTSLLFLNSSTSTLNIREVDV